MEDFKITNANAEFYRRSESDVAIEFAKAHVISAVKDGLARLPRDHEPAAEQRVINGIARRLGPYLAESFSVADQVHSPEHKAYLREFDDYTDHSEIGEELCPDSRTDPFNVLAGHGEAKVDRRLAGLPDTRLSTSPPYVPVIDDPDLATNLENALDQRGAQGHPKQLTEIVTSHTVSTAPYHGCGYLTGETAEAGHTPLIGMKFGGLKEYEQRIKGGFSAFNNNAQLAGGVGTTFYGIIDHYSQGLVVAPYDLTRYFQRSDSLRKNLLDLNAQGVVTMSEMLDDDLGQEVRDLAGRMGVSERLNLRDYRQQARNARLLGKIAMEIGEKRQKEGRLLTPETVLQQAGATPTAAKIMDYLLIRNSAARILSGLVKGNHSSMNHFEQFLRVGWSGAEGNSSYVPFVQRTAAGRISDQDVAGARKLYGLLEGTLIQQGVSLEDEGRVILVTGEFDADEYRTTEIAAQKLKGVENTIAGNAAKFRTMFADSIATGETVVVGAVFNARTKDMDSIVTKRETS